jgi:hypothetical protein
MLINFIDWFIKPLGYQVLPIGGMYIDVIGKKIVLDNALANKIAHVIINHKPEYKDNVVRLDERV